MRATLPLGDWRFEHSTEKGISLRDPVNFLVSALKGQLANRKKQKNIATQTDMKGGSANGTCQNIQNRNLEEFSRAGVQPVSLSVYHSEEPKTGSDVILRREGSEISAAINLNWGYRYTVETRDKIACYAYWLSRADSHVSELLIDGSDGNFPTFSKFRFSAREDEMVLMPDAHFFRDHGYRETDQYAREHAVAWDDRSDQIVWRGGPNGTGLFALGEDIVSEAGIIQRLRMAYACRPLGIDFRFVEDPTSNMLNPLAEADLIGDFVPTNDWGHMKYAIDIDGWTNAWSNLMQRLKLGCCVLKVQSPFGYRQWYYDSLIPWQHYVPVSADLTDLPERVDWVRSNREKARAIAAEGQELAMKMTFDSETAVAIDAINRHAEQNQ